MRSRLKDKFSPSDLDYIREFSAGQRAFVERHSDLTLDRFEKGDITGALIEGSKLTAIPEHAEGPVEVLRAVARSERFVQWTMQCIGEQSLDNDRNEIIELAHQTYPIVPEEIPSIIERSRLLLFGHEVVEWTQALQTYTSTTEFHGAAISALELAHAHSLTSDEHSIRLDNIRLSAYTIAADSAQHRLTELSPEADNRAERASVRTHLIAALRPQADHYLTFDRLSGNERRRAMSIIYELEDSTTLSNDYLQRAYTLLKRSTWADIKARRFFSEELNRITDRITQEQLRAQGRTFFAGLHTERQSPSKRPKA